ncbi:MAG: phosphoribosylformylglycinamidine cyclo-ligase [Planctomycetales bacterium]|nr:phosphoribosylformylglycinamidine cyclo-ligase [Planctomycetales bacterium]
MTRVTYRDAGVDIEKSDRFKERLFDLVRQTYGPQVIERRWGYGGTFALDGDLALFRRSLKDPVLVACTDNVGTKVLLAQQLKVYHTVGVDLVAMSVNDLIVNGAEPLFFLDYIGTGKLDEERDLRIVQGIVDGCRQAGCALLGGETAEAPDLFPPDRFDLAGFAIGIADRSKLLDGTAVEIGDVLVGVGSSGVHSNGFTLVRRTLAAAGLDLHRTYDALGPAPLGDVLLTPTRIYAKAVRRALGAYKVKRMVRAMAHITGSGIAGNLPRNLPAGVKAVVRRDSWPVPPVFPFLQEQGGIPDEEMWNVFNMGLGFILVVHPQCGDAVIRRLERSGEDAWVVGEIVAGTPGAEATVELA